ncbi:hypothetical protein V6L77_11135 [Pannonibacter sp. Pt2-lr]
MLAVFERRPFSVTGDGVSQLRALITQATQGFAAGGKGSKIAADDPRILAFLATSGLDLTHVPEAGAAVALCPTRISSGGSAVDVTGTISSYFAEIARKAGKPWACGYSALISFARILRQGLAPMPFSR